MGLFRGMFRFLNLALFCQICLAPGPNIAAAPPPSDRESLLSLLKEREAKIGSARFEFSRDYLLGDSVVRETPDEDATFSHNQVKSSILVAREMLRIEVPYFNLASSPKDQPSTLLRQRSFDGELEYDLDAPRRSDVGPMRRGGIGAAKKSPDRSDIHLLGILLATQPVAVLADAQPPGKWVFAAEADSSSNSSLVSLTSGETGPRAPVYKLLFDRSQGSLPTTYQYYLAGALRVNVVIEYSPDNEFGFMPREYTSTMYHHDGSIHESSVNRISSYRINLKVSKKDFQVTFPKDTLVYDKRTEQEFVAGDDGKLKLMISPSSVPNRASNNIGGTVLLIMNVLILVVAVFLIYRRLRKR